MGEQSELGKRIVKDMQKDKLIDELFESVAQLTLRVNAIEQNMDWQREIAMREISKLSQEQGYNDENVMVRGEERKVSEFDNYTKPGVVEDWKRDDWSKQTTNQLNEKEETE